MLPWGKAYASPILAAWLGRAGDSWPKLSSMPLAAPLNCSGRGALRAARLGRAAWPPRNAGPSPGRRPRLGGVLSGPARRARHALVDEPGHVRRAVAHQPPHAYPGQDTPSIKPTHRTAAASQPPGHLRQGQQVILSVTKRKGVRGLTHSNPPSCKVGRCQRVFRPRMTRVRAHAALGNDLWDGHGSWHGHSVLEALRPPEDTWQPVSR